MRKISIKKIKKKININRYVFKFYKKSKVISNLRSKKHNSIKKKFKCYNNFKSISNKLIKKELLKFLGGSLDMDSLEISQKNKIFSMVSKMIAVKKITNRNKLSLYKKQILIEKLSYINTQDIEYLKKNKSKSDSKFLLLIKKFLLPENVYFWKPTNLLKILKSNRKFKINIKRRKESPFQEIFSIFKNFEKKFSANHFAYIVLYALKSLIKNDILSNDMVERIIFLRKLFENIMSSIRSFYKCKPIISNIFIISKFCVQILMPLLAQYNNLDLKTLRETEGGVIDRIYFFVKNEKVYKSLNLKILIPQKLPLLIPPRNWKFDANENIIKGGGYFINKLFLYDGIHCKNHLIGLSKQKSELSDVINHLQKNKFIIKRDMEFNSVANFLKDYLFETFKINILIIKNNNIKIIPFEDSILYNKNSFIQKANLVKYKEIFQSIIENIFSWCCMKVYKKFKFYFSLYFDFRGRIYQNANPLNLTFANTFVKKYMIFYPGNLNSIEIDATTSGISIISGILGDERLLELTNILKSPNQCFKLDFYMKILSLMEGVFSRARLDIGIDEKSIIYSYIDGLFKDRKLIKKLSMNFSYNETDYTRKSILLEYLTSKIIIKKGTPPYKKKKIKEDIYLLSIYLNTCFLEVLNNLSPNLNRFVEILNSSFILDSIKKQKGIQVNSLFCSFFFFKQLKTGKNSRCHVITGEKISIPGDPKLLSVDALATRRSLIANWIQSLDSALLHQVILDCIELKIQVFTVHDSFRVLKKNEAKLKELYSNAFFKHVLFSEFGLHQLLKINNVIIDSETKNVLKSIIKNKEKIKKKLEQQVLLPSNFCLSGEISLEEKILKAKFENFGKNL